MRGGLGHEGLNVVDSKLSALGDVSEGEASEREKEKEGIKKGGDEVVKSLVNQEVGIGGLADPVVSGLESEVGLGAEGVKKSGPGDESTWWEKVEEKAAQDPVKN